MERLDILAVGTALVDSIIKGFDPKPVSASGYRAASGSLNAGGEAVNEAIAAAKLGMQTGILCSLGVDTAGDMLMDVLHRGGVDTSRVLRDEAHPTPVTTMFVHDDGTRKSITNGAHRYNFRPDHHLDRLTGARAVILGSLFRAPFDDPDVVLTVAKTVKAEGALLVADTKLPNFTLLTLDDLRDVLPLIDYITPNEDEAKFYTGQTEPEAMAEVFLGAGVKNVILKLGAKGCYFRNKTEKFALPAWRASRRRGFGAAITNPRCALRMPAARSAQQQSAQVRRCKTANRYRRCWQRWGRPWNLCANASRFTAGCRASGFAIARRMRPMLSAQRVVSAMNTTAR